MIRPYNRAEIEFKCVKEIGAEGKNSRVFLAHDPQLDADLVIKQVDKSQFGGCAEYFSESSILYAGAHANVVEVHYACQDDNSVYIAMPYYREGSLKAFMGQRFLSVREIIVFATQFLSGLHHIHSKRLIHFDIKPDNILISDRGEAVLSDFGLARHMAFGGQAGQDRIYGKMTPPEAFGNDQFTHRFDIYQVGLTLYRMCVGDAAFNEQLQAFVQAGKLDRDAFRFAVQTGRFPDKGVYPDHIPQPLKTCIARCIEIEPSNRYSSVIEIVNQLADIDGKILDWRYSVSDGNQLWEKVVDEKTCRLAVSADGSSVATKQAGDSRPRRISKFCKERITTREIRGFLKEN